jgi:hypothetical protein
MLETFRMALGDYTSVSTAIYMEDSDNFCFWIIWLAIVIITCVIFLNFIIAEACHSYEEVSENLEQFLCK